jgi:uncharacterized protein involved in response to NO
MIFSPLHPFWGRGFRPFFLGASLFAAYSLVFWLLFLTDIVNLPSTISDAIGWHAHEMVYGFAMAVIAGFLLTAVANWTGWSPVRGYHLAGLVALWLAGRIAPYIPGLPQWALIAIETSFIPTLAISLFVPLYKSRNIRNYIFLVLLSLLFICDLIFLLTSQIIALYVAIFVISAMISLVGGRIIPAFTVAALRQRGHINIRNKDQPLLDKLALASWLALALAYIFTQGSGYFMAIVAAAAAAIHLLRLRHYNTLPALLDPLLWILHVAYIWIIVGLIMLAISSLSIISPIIGIHALTIGAIGSATLGMMSRVALGHTGRTLICHPAIICAFYLMQGAALARIVGPAALPEYHVILVTISGLLWCASFLIYAFIYTPVLLQARPDGQPV